PPPPEDYYGLSAGDSAADIKLWAGDLADGESAYLVVAVREQDNAQLAVFVEGIEAIAEAIVAIVTEDPDLGQKALNDLTQAARDHSQSSSIGADKPLAIFSVNIRVESGIAVAWSPVQSCQVMASGTSASLGASGAGSSYKIEARVPETPAGYCGAFRGGS